MRLALLLHITAGMLGLIAGAVALYSKKGAWRHRKSGMLFVSAMLVMATGGFIVSIASGVAPAINLPAAAITAYLVVTALTTVRPPSTTARRVDIAALAVGLITGAASMAVGIAVLASPGMPNGFAFPLFMFGTVGLLGARGDAKVLRAGPPRGNARLVRHLWRMSFALFIAALAFFVGQADVFPEPIRIRPLLALPVMAVLVTMLYWLWRMRGGDGALGTVPVTDVTSPVPL